MVQLDFFVNHEVMHTLCRLCQGETVLLGSRRHEEDGKRRTPLGGDMRHPYLLSVDDIAAILTGSTVFIVVSSGRLIKPADELGVFLREACFALCLDLL